MRNIEENASENVMRVLVGNKSDLHDRLVISTQQGQALADQFQIAFFETSAKSQTSPNVAQMFHFLAEKLLIEEQKQQPNPDREKSTIDVSDKSAMSSFSSCCYSTGTPEK
jgi:GTPase SAR1 family protein